MALALGLLVSVSAPAQTVRGDRFTLKTGPCVERSGSGSPEAVVVGNQCDVYRDTGSGLIYYKVSGNGTSSGWVSWATANTASYLVARDASGNTALTSLFGGGTGHALLLGGTGINACGTNPPTTANCEAAAVLLPSSYVEQRLSTDTAYRTQWYVGSDGGHLTAYNGGGWMPLRVWGGPIEIGGGGLHIGSTDILDPGLGNAGVDGYIGKPGYVSQTTGWRIDELGAADFRYLYTDELHAKAFIADLEQALAGGQIITKSVAQVGAVFTVPGPGNISTLTVKDLPSAANMAVFESGDTVRVRTFSRAAGSLSITDAWGTVASYTDLEDGLQSWLFTRLSINGGTMAGDTEIAIDSIVLDYGVSGNGFYEVNAIDGLYGINSPYAQIVTWSGNSPLAANQTLRTRFGNLRGITAVDGEYGFIAGTYAATDGTYLRASNQAFELHGIDLKMWNGSTNVLRIDHTTPYWSMGDPAPTTYSAGGGCWSGIDAGAFKWRCGDIAGGTNYISWDGGSGVLNVKGNIIIEGTGIDADTLVGVAGATVVSGAALGALGIDANGNPLLPHAATPSGSGLFLGGDYLGYYTAGAWKTYMSNTGGFYLGGVAGALQWNGTTLTISGTLSGNGSGITSITGGNITTDSITATQIAANAITTSELNADSVTSAKIAAGTIVAADIAAGTITATEIAAATITGAKIAAGTITATQIGANSLTAAVIDAGAIGTSELAALAVTADKLSVATLSAISANLGTVTAGTVTGVTLSGSTVYGGSGNEVTLNSSGITLTSGSGATNRYKFSDGSYLSSVSGYAGFNSVHATAALRANNGTIQVQIRSDTGSFDGVGPVVNLGQAGTPWGNAYISGNIYNNPADTTGDDNPIVYSAANGFFYEKTDGHSGVLCSGYDLHELTVESGIVISAYCDARPEVDVHVLQDRISQLEWMVGQLLARENSR